MKPPKRYERTTPVEIVQPNRGWSGFVLHWGEFFAATWLVMLALGALVPFPAAHLGYWSVAFGILAVRTLLPGSSYLYWTRAKRQVKS